MKKSFLSFCLLIIAGACLHAQTLMNENFNYKTGALTSLQSGANVSGGNWTSFSGTGFPLTVSAANLTYAGYGSATGKSISLFDTVASAEDAYRQFATQTSGTVYCALLLKVTDTVGLAPNTSTTPDYFSGFLASSSTTAFVARLSIRKGLIGNTYQLGIKGNNNNTVAYTTTNLALDSTQLIVFSYSIVTGANNDSARLWINPSVSAMPAVADAKSTITTAGEASDVARVFLRQGSAGTPNCIVDGIHTGLSWADVMGTGPGPIPPANGLTAVSSGLNSVSFTWNRPGDYDPATMQTLVFVKPTSAITTGTPTANPANYIANSDFAIGGTAYQNDPLAKCVLNGDTNTITITGLTIATNYNVAVLIVRTADSAYATVATLQGSTQANKPSVVSVPIFSATSFTNTTYSWTKPAGYIDSNMTVLVFLKATIIPNPTGTINANPTLYIANADYSANGTKFVNDTLAKCVYNGDGTTVNITGLVSGVTYYTATYVVRSTDSNYYSNTTISGVTTITQPGAVTALNVNATGQTTATVAWTKPTGYNNTTMTTLVFVKDSNAISTVLHPTKNPTGYSPNPDFSLTGTPFQYDARAKCVMNTDSSFVNITGLALSTAYHVLVYVVRMSDSVYSIESNSFGITYGSVLPPKPLTAVSLKANGASTALATWTKDSTFVDSTNTILVFAKKGSSIVQGAPTVNTNTYSASAVFGNGTSYQNDTAAKCVYKGTGTNISITGLQPATSYFMVAYVVRTADSSYSSAMSSTSATVSNPVTGISVVGQSGTSSRISWSKPAGYVNTTYSTLVFVKADTAITVGTPTRNPAAYGANINMGVGSKFQNDPLAYCVFKADTNFITVNSLVQSKHYEVLILVVRDADSAYSVSASGSGTTLPAPAPVTIGSINTTNATTGNPDSLGVRITVRGLVYGTNQTTIGLKFLLRDATGGITVMITGKNFGYTPVEGDSIEAQGSVSTTQGLLYVAIDTMYTRGSGKTIKAPTVVSKLGETTENDLIRINKIKFLTAPGTTWTPRTYLCLVDGTSDTVTVRVTPGSVLVGTVIPVSSTFSVIGIGGQVSTSIAAPFLFNGYQIIPRATKDIIVPDSLAPFSLLLPQTNDTLVLTDSGMVVNFKWNGAKSFGSTKAVYTVMLDTFGGTFATPLVQLPSNTTGTDSMLTVSSMALSSAIKLAPNHPYKFIWKVRATAGTYTEYSNIVPFYITRLPFTGIQSVNAPKSFELYPNPASGIVFINHTEPMQTVTIMNQLGQVIMQQLVNTREATITNLDRGIYFVRIETTAGTITQKLILN